MQAKQQLQTSGRCSICKKSFGWLRRIHKCKRCQRNVCSDCGTSKRRIIGYIDNNPHRTCDGCEIDIQFQMKLCRTNNIEWNTLSLIGKEWLESIKDMEHLKKDKSYEYYLNESKKFENTRDFHEIEEDVMLGRADLNNFNYSMQEFFFIAQQSKNKMECRCNIRNVLRAFCVRHQSIGHIQGINIIVAYLLCFLNEENAFWVLNYIIEKIIPKEFYSRTAKNTTLFGFYSECHVLKEAVTMVLGLKVLPEAKMIHHFLDIIFPAILIPLLIDTLSAEGLFYVWDKMIKNKDFCLLEKTVLVLVEHCRKFILQKSNSSVQEFRQFFIQDITPDVIMVRTSKINLCAKDFEELRKKYEKEFDDFWKKKAYDIKSTVSSLSKFKKFEINDIYKQFNGLLRDKYSRLIAKDEFMKLLQSINPSESINTTETVALFDVFDLDHDEKLDVIEFLSCSTLFLKGDFDNKLMLCFKLCDMRSRNYLTPQECVNFLEIVCCLGVVVGQNNMDSHLLTLMARFKQGVYNIIKNYAKIKYSDVLESIQQDAYIKMLYHLLKGRKSVEGGDCETEMKSLRRSLTLPSMNFDAQQKERQTLTLEKRQSRRSKSFSDIIDPEVYEEGRKFNLD